jgi:hypothetical protein
MQVIGSLRSASRTHGPEERIMSIRGMVLALLLLTLGFPLLAAQPGAFENDPRLAKRISVAEPMTRISDVVQQIGDQCGVKLVADTDLGSDTIVLVCKDQPAGEVLQQLAAILGFTWSRSESARGYRLVEGVASKERRRRLNLAYRARAAGPLNRYLQLLHVFLDKFRDQPVQQVHQQLEDMATAIPTLPTSRERLKAEEEYAAAANSHKLPTRALLLAYESLPAEAKQRLLLGERVIMSTSRPGTIPMPEPVLEALRAARDRSPGPRDDLQPARQTADEALDFLADLKLGCLMVRGRAIRLWDGHDAPAVRWPTILLTPSRYEFGPPLVDAIPGEVTADRPEDLARRVHFVWSGKREDPKHPLTYFSGVLVPDVLEALRHSEPDLRLVGNSGLEPIRAITPNGAGDTASPETADQLLNRLSAGPGREGKLPLGDLLREVAQRSNTSFHLAAGGAIRCRSTVSFRSRGSQVDLQTLSRLFEPVVTVKAYTPADAIQAASGLSFAQAEALSGLYLGFLGHHVDFEQFSQGWAGWRLLGNLTEAQRTALYAGTPLRYGQLTPAGQKALRAYLTDIAVQSSDEPIDLEVTNRDLPGLYLELTAARGKQRLLTLRHTGVKFALATTPLQAKW